MSQFNVEEDPIPSSSGGFTDKTEEERNETKVYPNGDAYTGQFSNGKKDGFGNMKYTNGNVYKGIWKNDYKDGKGFMDYSNGDIYEGDWKYD
jgi:hypothetical protein